MSVQSEIIDPAFNDLGLSAVGEALSAAVYADGLARLNMMVSSWSTEQVTVNTMKHQTLTLAAGTNAYTVGTGGSLVTTANPIRITGAQSVSGNQRMPVRIVSFDQFDAEVNDPLGSRSIFAKVLATDNSFPSINIRVWPMPDTAPASLALEYWSAISSFSNLSDVITLAPGYIQALHFNLAVALAPQYQREGGIPDSLAANAASSKAALNQLNAQILGLIPAVAQEG